MKIGATSSVRYRRAWSRRHQPVYNSFSNSFGHVGLRVTQLSPVASGSFKLEAVGSQLCVSSHCFGANPVLDWLPRGSNYGAAVAESTITDAGDNPA